MNRRGIINQSLHPITYSTKLQFFFKSFKGKKLQTFKAHYFTNWESLFPKLSEKINNFFFINAAKSIEKRERERERKEIKSERNR